MSIVTTPERLNQAKALFNARFRDMSVSCTRWHLYAVRGGMVIEPADAPDRLVVLVESVHAMDLQTLMARLQNRLSRGTPHLWYCDGECGGVTDACN